MPKERQQRNQDLVSFTVRLPEDLLAKLDALASSEERSRNAQIVVLLRKALAFLD